MITATLEDIMCDHPITVKEDVSVGVVAHLLLRYRINGILVVNRDNKDELIGIFTTTDLLSLINLALSEGGKKIEKLNKLSEFPVGEVSSKNIISFQKNDKVTKVIAVMHKKNVHTIPIFHHNKLVGVVGRHDILNVALSS